MGRKKLKSTPKLKATPKKKTKQLGKRPGKDADTIYHNPKEPRFKCVCGEEHEFGDKATLTCKKCKTKHAKVEEYLTVRAGQGVGIYHPKKKK